MRRRISRWLWVAGTPARHALLAVIWVYRGAVGTVVGGKCRFYPSCSAYAEQAVRQSGAVRGLGLTVWRVLRCSPLSRGGVDYPPRHQAAVTELPLYDSDIHTSPVGVSTRKGTPT